MARPKFDGIIEAVRYTPDGKIDLVRAYERRGAIFTYIILLDRKTLIERIKTGQRFMTGQRKKFWASTFEPTKRVRLLTQNGNEVVTTRVGNPVQDVLDVPRF